LNKHNKLASIYYDSSVRTLEMVLDKHNMRASLTVLSMSLNVLDLMLATSWDFLCKFTSKRMRRIVMLLKESWGALRRLWL